MLVSANPLGTDIWNTIPGISYYNNSVPISATGPSASVLPGQTATFTFIANAPSPGPGTFNFQWTMMHNFVRFFGDVTPNVVCTEKTDNAAFVSQVPPPSTMTAGQSYPVSVTMQNTGDSTWADGTCQLLSENPRGNQFLGPSNTQPVVGTVLPGQSTTVSFNVVASTPGSYNFQWTMSRKNIHEFGTFSPNIPVTVVAASAPPFQITGINNGDTLSGDVVVNVALPNDNLNGGSLSLAVDGITVDAGDVQLQADGSYAEAMTVATNNSGNGVHTIVVSDGRGHSDTRTVTFSNVITNLACGAIFDLSANSDGVPQSCHITATLALAQAWQVAIQDYNGNTVRSYSGNGTSIDVTWDGKDSLSNVVPDASYNIVITTGATGSSAASPNAAGTATHRPVAKNSIGASLVLVNDEPSAMIGGAASGMAYEKFLISILTPKTGIDFTSKPSPIFTTGAALAADPALRSRINSQFSIPCSLIYVYTHGSDVSKPRFSIGGWYWYSEFPLIDDGVPSNRRFDVSSYTALAGYEQNNAPPLLA